MNKLVFVILALSALCSNNTQAAQDDIKVGRYSHIQNTPTQEQLNPLRVVVKTRLPQSIKTIGDATQFLLVRSGFTLVDKNLMSQEVKELMNLKLPQVHRNIGPLTLDVILGSFVGEAYRLVVDPVRRKITFVLAEEIEV